MKFINLLVFVAPMLFVGAADADVIKTDAGGFVTINELVIETTRLEAWQAAVNEIGQWWSSDHTVSGDAARLSIDARPQGCFCEDLGDGAGVVHLDVTMVNPAVVLRLTGALGPLGLMGVNGNMTWEFSEADAGTAVRFTYAVGGYRPDGLDSIAGAVDAVIAEALQRLKDYAETGDAERGSGDRDR